MQYPINSPLSGARYFVEGVRLLLHPKLRAYILIPLLVNIALFVVLTGALIYYIGVFQDGLHIDVPDWLQVVADFLLHLLSLVLIVLVLIIYAYSFNIITNIIAAPFYGMLAEKAEELLTGTKIESEPLVRMIPRVFKRELKKLLYFIIRGILISLIMLLVGLTVPVVGTFLAPLIGLAWSAWCMTLQYADYPADNHRCSFTAIRRKLAQRSMSSFGFGGMITACSVIPVLNIIAMPAAVTGGTIYWLNELRDCPCKY
ncbi:sulfate transporter CysZ [Teredinibacter turnerae]|uniref:Sulfate transporter CysZ n=1 Tax=Teredinibacter turnerae (strain ATCC 39867 / T7901) TaxID=377629 RepID=C5BSZ1_TERTT|nr:sulfate transporter CysZ [Teredinibacter turnerae]ACR12947.1 protein CysZ [Teredinibacter turnerae T7901]